MVNWARTPSLPPDAFQTWSTRYHWRQATCVEVDCDHHREGWRVVLAETTPEGRKAADYIRYHAGREVKESKDPAGLTQFDFPPGQTCFKAHEHRIQAQRPPLYVVQAGDWRATAGKPRVYDRGDQFADDLHTHTDKLTAGV